MEIKQIESLARIMSRNGLTELEVSEGDLKICMKKGSAGIQPQPAINIPLQSVESSVETDTAKVENKTNKGASFNGLQEITSPLAGVYYASPSPDAAPFVKIGDKVKKGDVLCIIEAMKLMNELTAERDGEIADICVKNEQIVEYGQTLFTLY